MVNEKKAERKEEGHWLFRAVHLDFSQKDVKIVHMNLYAIRLSEGEW
jgi:hypothetical protein